jgi:hypothetical protein
MLFDLQSGKRRTVIRVVYAALAALFLFGFVLFGIGSEVSGGLGDVIGLGSNDTEEADPATQFDSQLDQAQKRLAQNPDDQDALLDVARYGFLAGNAVAPRDESTQQPVADEAARGYWNPALDAWERYLKTDPKEIDLTVAPQMVVIYQLLGDASGAAATQELIADAQPSLQAYGTLAFYEYSAGNIAAGDAASKKAVAEANGKQKQQVQKQLDDIAKQARAQKKAAGEASPGEGPGQLQSPFGGLGSSAAPPAPTP